mmetsp:Transcript_69873/g.158557  ORF Transcript_69873/g.158557 Transcript_69873/m.158557 type:complete len:217 (-) Transcript_69873:89-739(-)
MVGSESVVQLQGSLNLVGQLLRSLVLPRHVLDVEHLLRQAQLRSEPRPVLVELLTEALDLAHEKPQVHGAGLRRGLVEPQPRLRLSSVVLAELLDEAPVQGHEPVSPELVPLRRRLGAPLQGGHAAQDVQLGPDVQVPDADRLAGPRAVGNWHMVEVAVLVDGHLEGALRDVVPDVDVASSAGLVPPGVKLQTVAALAWTRALLIAGHLRRAFQDL